MQGNRSQAVAFVLSVLLGWLGVDRFYMGQILLGILKLVTLGGFGLWIVIDNILIGMGVARDGDGKLLARPSSPDGRSQGVAFLLSYFVGVFGVDRMYMGSILLGILKLVTLGGFGIWALVDIFLIGMGVARDGEGRPLSS